MAQSYDKAWFDAGWAAMLILSNLPDYDAHQRTQLCDCEGCMHIAHAIDYIIHELGLDEE